MQTAYLSQVLRTGRAVTAAIALGVVLAASGPLRADPGVGMAPILVAAEHPADPECLNIAQSSGSTYTVTNSACADESVLASIELAGGSNLARCFVKKIRTQISIASEGAAPVINYQCIEGAKDCSFEIVRDMFPECHSG
jgi:hypothetical protein